MEKKFNFNLEEVKKQAPQIFNDITYDSILHICKIMFGNKCVTYSEKNIFIKDKINLQLSLSWNETKVYFYTYFDLDTDKGERLNNAGEVNGILRCLNPCFRLFTLQDIANYLIMKEQENRFIRENEG